MTLTVLNAVVTKPGGTTYTFEVATDAAFTAKVQTKDGVAEGSGGQTSVKLDALAAAKDYYWHARATAGGTTGVFGAAFKFTIGPAISINAPVPIAPVNGAATGARPALRATNATRTGPAGAISYRFEISTTSTFSSILVTGTNSEGVNETGFIPTADLPSNATLFWRVTAIDPANAISSPASTTQSFVTSLTIDLTKVVYLKGPDLSTWKQTGRILSVEQDGSAAAGGPMCISFTDPGWPDAKWIYGGDDPNFGDLRQPVVFREHQRHLVRRPGRVAVSRRRRLQGRPGHQDDRSRQRIRQPVLQLGAEARRARRLCRLGVGESPARHEHRAGAHRRGPGPMARQLASSLHEPGDPVQAIRTLFEEMDTMRSFVALAIGMLALSGVASAQTPARASDTDHGYVEGVIQSAFGNVTSQSYGAELGFTVIPNVQVFVEAGMVRDAATASIGTAAQLMAGVVSQTQANVAFRVKEPVTFGVAGLKFVVPTAGCGRTCWAAAGWRA